MIKQTLKNMQAKLLNQLKIQHLRQRKKITVQTNKVSTPKEENNTTDNKKTELAPDETAKINLLAGIFKLSPDSLNIIETPYGKAVNFSLGEKTETILINDIDRLLAALLANAKPKETPTENENSTTLNSEKEVSDNE